MKIVFKRNKKKVEIPVFGPSEVKLYAVPTAYSADGYFAGVWASGELEPVPACPLSDAALLAHVELASAEMAGSGQTLREHFCEEGVSYALD